MKSNRHAGILLHITSLPGPAYIGDIGNAAKRFAEFLYGSGQTWWQLLPVQPVSQEQSFSPYSSSSSVAGNSLLISPEWLVEKKLLDENHLIKQPSAHKVNYPAAKVYKEKLLDISFRQSFVENDDFNSFVEKESYWLDDFALYTVLKNTHANRPWYQWPEQFKKRHRARLDEFAADNRFELQKTKWIQYIFHCQWKELREYCDSLHIQLIGDVPFYVGHDSADVWANPDIFDIDEQGYLLNVAGAPPDDFNADGQLWGMPVFRWTRVRQRDYDWWLTRIKKNLEYFDVLRLDHFRAFAAFWNVPAGERTARNGSWIEGPGKEFFQKLEEELGSLPFIAEDLGDIDEPVHQLRDELNLPGMNVLHFAFGDDMPESQYLPHFHVYNSLVYTGTHDNNTTLGWFDELPEAHRKNIADYTGLKPRRKEIATQLMRLAYMSGAKIAMLPMQDVLHLDGRARMNNPASPDNNWLWRLKSEQMTEDIEKLLNLWSFNYGRMRD